MEEVDCIAHSSFVKPGLSTDDDDDDDEAWAHFLV